MANYYGGGYAFGGQTQPPPPPFNPYMPNPPSNPGPYGYYSYPTQPVGQPFPPMRAPEVPNAQAGADWSGNSFNDKAIRRAFVRKVFSILMLQLLITTVIISACIFIPSVQSFVRTNMWAYYSSFAIFFGVFIALACCEGVRRQFPLNFICLIIFTLAMSYMTGVLSSFYKTEIVLLSFGICTVVCFSIVVFAIQTKFDITTKGTILFVLFVIVFIFGILAIFLRNKIVHLIYSALIAIVFMGYLAYDVQMLMGNKKFSISPEEYIFAALQLYLDIIYIFTAILSLTGGLSDN